MRKLLLPFVVVSLLSAAGMFYFHYFRFDCTPIPIEIGEGPAKPREGPEKHRDSLKYWRDWEGNCFLNITHERGSQEYPGLWVVEKVDRLKWTAGEWQPIEYEPYDPYKKKGRP